MNRLLLPFFLLLAAAVAADPSAPSAPGLPTLVNLGAGTCVPCKLMEPVRAALKTEYAGQLQVVFHDVVKDRAAGRTYGVRVIPTQIFLDAGGKELFRHEGFWSKAAILAKFQELGVALQAPAAAVHPKAGS